ncbi:hypothetical protein DRO38_04650, partial [Candidatus Bathyarchaeota archaeon]
IQVHGAPELILDGGGHVDVVAELQVLDRRPGVHDPPVHGHSPFGEEIRALVVDLPLAGLGISDGRVGDARGTFGLAAVVLSSAVLRAFVALLVLLPVEAAPPPLVGADLVAVAAHSSGGAPPFRIVAACLAAGLAPRWGDVVRAIFGGAFTAARDLAEGAGDPLFRQNVAVARGALPGEGATAAFCPRRAGGARQARVQSGCRSGVKGRVVGGGVVDGDVDPYGGDGSGLRAIDGAPDPGAELRIRSWLKHPLRSVADDLLLVPVKDKGHHVVLGDLHRVSLPVRGRYELQGVPAEGLGSDGVVGGDSDDVRGNSLYQGSRNCPGPGQTE